MTKTYGLATASLVIGIFGLIFSWIPFFGLILGILALVFGIVGINKINKNTTLKGKGLAITGIVLGIITIIIGFSVIGSMNPDNLLPEQNTKVISEQKTTQTTTPKIISQKTESATLTIDRIQVQLANLYPTRLTVNNTGDVSITPKFDIYVYDKNNKEICTGSPIIDTFGTVPAKETKTEEISILGCVFEEDGTYTLKIDLLDSDYTKLSTQSKEFNVDYWGKFT